MIELNLTQEEYVHIKTVWFNACCGRLKDTLIPIFDGFIKKGVNSTVYNDFENSVEHGTSRKWMVDGKEVPCPFEEGKLMAGKER